MLAEAYAQEAELARAESEESDGDAGSDRLVGWVAAVESYAGQLRLLIEDIETGFPVHLGAVGDAELAVTVAERTVILSHPRVDGQDDFEHAILENFCTRHPCERFTPGTAPPQPIPVSAGNIRPRWAFTEAGPVCSMKGISVHFSPRADLPAARSICRQFLHETVTLANEIAWQVRHAVPVDWERLELQAIAGRPEHRLQLNDAGDNVLVAAPVLRGSPGLLRVVLPWVRAGVAGEATPRVDIRARDHGWENVPG